MTPRCALPASSSIATASEKHRALVADAIAALGIPVFGAVPREVALALPERHLGLVQAGEHADLAALIDRLAAMAERHLDLDAMIANAAPLRIGAVNEVPTALPPPGQRIALAQDRAFSFVYPHLLEAWRRAGAEIVPFSPLADEPRPKAPIVAGCPAAIRSCMPTALAAADRFKTGLRRFAETRPVHGECGGYMVLGESIEDAAGKHHAMTGLLGHATSFAKRKLHLGYRTARLLVRHCLGTGGRGRARPRIPLRHAGFERRR